ncbi:helix-turn-helix domain-containing protein [Actinoplanes solisilvae]|uniref:helix-turn-helix domain-containing protein n=1 Tax=Actinoplanes solisilvae TaxID=2486853 RepID=UPI000FDC5825|nr:helix-turn-helix domain-containing protein [Actinoplanes solisilvae]
MAEDVPFGVLLRRLRLAAGLTLEQLAQSSGVTDRAISDLERGVSRNPRLRTAEAVADGLKLDGRERAALLAAARRGRQSSTPVVSGLPLPRRVADFTGRHSELAQVRAWTAGAGESSPAPVVVISGAPGVGKTSLAVQAAQVWPADEQLFVDLRGLDARPLAPATVLGRLIRAVSADQPAVPRDVDEATALWHTLIRGRRFVVVLDNAMTESQIRPVLPPHGPTVVLVTSRRALSGLEGVRRMRLDALPSDDAVRLLSAILDDAGTRSSPESLRRIAELCVNVPLALRIAGNRLLSRPGWTPDDLITRLTEEEQRLDALAAGDLEVKAAFTLSYQQLSPIAQRVFRRLALVPGTSTGVELAGVLAEETIPATEQALDELVELSLLQQRPDGRLEFHDLLRLYAGLELDREEDSAARVAAIRRRDAWLLDKVVDAGRLFPPGPAGPPGQAFDWLKREAENWLPALRRAAREGDDQRVLDAAESLHWYSDRWPSWPHWVTVFTLSSRAAERLGDERLRAVHLGYLAWVHIVCLNQPDKALDHARNALDCAERCGDQRQIGWADFYAGWALTRRDRWPEALGYARRAVTRFRTTGDPGLPSALLLQALAVQAIGPPDDAIPLIDEALAAVPSSGAAPPAVGELLAALKARAPESSPLHNRLTGPT